jgi:hypothetical protein
MRIGTDPEAFVVDAGNRPVPAHRFFGNKDEKREVAPGIWAFRDGYAVELNVPPQSDVVDLMGTVAAGWRGVQDLLPRGLRLEHTPTMRINLKKDLADAPEDVKHFGCEPSYCAYLAKSKIPKINAWEHPWRYAGAHMHFSANPVEVASTHKWLKNKANHLLFIRLMDQMVGWPLTAEWPILAQFQRRRYYGQAGEFRPQEYPDGSIGLEYRTPASGQLRDWCFQVGMVVFNNFEHYASLPPVDLREEINMGKGVFKRNWRRKGR